MGPLAVFAIFAVLIVVSLAALGFALVVARSASRPRPALPLNCGDCVFIIPRAKVYRQETIEDADGLDEWKTGPFEPTERDGHLFARGVSDNKGNLMGRLQAIEAYRATLGELPLRVRVLYEGEEEIGSEHLAEFVKRNADRLRADG